MQKLITYFQSVANYLVSEYFYVGVHYLLRGFLTCIILLKMFKYGFMNDCI